MTMAGFIHFVMRLDKDIFSVYNGLIYPSSPFRSQGILLINQSICITYPSSDLEKKTIFNQ